MDIHYISSTLRKQILGLGKKDDDSSDDEKKPGKAKKDDKDLHPPARSKSKKRPPHLQELHAKLSKNRSKPQLDTTVDLLQALKVDAHTCEGLLKSDFIEHVRKQLASNRIQFAGKLDGDLAVLTSMFHDLVFADHHAGRRFFHLCASSVQSKLIGTDAYECMVALLHARPSSDRKDLKEERKRFVAMVKEKIDQGSAVCARDLPAFIGGCPNDAAKDLLKLLDSKRKVLDVACQESTELRVAIEALRTRMGTPSSRNHDLAVLVAEICDAGFHGTDLRYEKITKNLQNDNFSLRQLIGMLCPGMFTTRRQAEFVAGLLKHLVETASTDAKPCDFHSFLAAVLHSGAPFSPCMQLIGAEAVRAIKSADEAEALVAAMVAMVDETGLEKSQFTALALLANSVRIDLSSARHISRDLLRDALVEKLAEIHKSANNRAEQLSTPVSPLDREEEKARDRRIAEESKANLEKQTKQPPPKVSSLSKEVQGALKLMASEPDWKQKLDFAAKMSSQLTEKPSVSAQQVAIELASVGTQHAAEIQGILAAQLVADDAAELADEMLIARLKSGGDGLNPSSLANGLVVSWYQTQLFSANKTSLAATQDLSAMLARLAKKVDQAEVRQLNFDCKLVMRQRALGFKEPHQYTPDDWEVIRIIDQISDYL
jgi:hypothetical protein